MSEASFHCKLCVNLVAPDEDPAWRRFSSLERQVVLPFPPFLGLEIFVRPQIPDGTAPRFSELEELAEIDNGFFKVKRVIIDSLHGLGHDAVSLLAEDVWQPMQVGLWASEELLAKYYGFHVLPINIREKVSDTADSPSGSDGGDTANMRRGKAVGYWGERFLPDPASLVACDWHTEELSLIAAYLQAGAIYARYKGEAYCRLCPDSKVLGSDDLTDGEWVWPRGLDHYITDHGVRLPDELIETMRRNGWQVPGDAATDWEQEQRRPNYDLWVFWASATQDAGGRAEENL